jgi:hypothetical protein
MSKAYSKALLLGVKKYSLFNSLLRVLKELADSSFGYDVREKISPFYFRVNTQFAKIPYSVRRHWEKLFLEKVNSMIYSVFCKMQPELVVVYNSEFLLPETCEKMKKKAKLVFFLGDSPFFTPGNRYFLACLAYADLILAPDTFWLKQLNTIGLNKTSFFFPDIDSESYFVIKPSEQFSSFPETEVFYSGTCYVDSWGYKKALLMNQFTPFKFQLFGNSAWERWFQFFPALREHYKQSSYIPTPELNIMLNRTKLVPVDGNPGILNGFHLRLFETLGAGALPLIEYRKDVVDILFKGCLARLPLIDDYSKAYTVANYYLNNERERSQIVTELRNHISVNHNSVLNAQRIVDSIS